MFRILAIKEEIIYRVKCSECFAILETKDKEDLGITYKDGCYHILCPYCNNIFSVDPDSIDINVLYRDCF